MKMLHQLCELGKNMIMWSLFIIQTIFHILCFSERTGYLWNSFHRDFSCSSVILLQKKVGPKVMYKATNQHKKLSKIIVMQENTARYNSTQKHPPNLLLWAHFFAYLHNITVGPCQQYKAWILRRNKRTLAHTFSGLLAIEWLLVIRATLNAGRIRERNTARISLNVIDARCAQLATDCVEFPFPECRDINI